MTGRGNTSNSLRRMHHTRSQGPISPPNKATTPKTSLWDRLTASSTNDAQRVDTDSAIPTSTLMGNNNNSSIPTSTHMGNDDNNVDDTGGILDNNTTETLNSGTDNNPTISIVDTSDVEIFDTSATLDIMGGVFSAYC